MNKSLFLLLPFVFFACLSPEEINYSADKEIVALDELLEVSFNDQYGYQIYKEVLLDEVHETGNMPFDTVVLQNDLASLREFKYSRLIRDANYDLTQSGSKWIYRRKADENKGPSSIQIEKDKGSISFVNILTKEDNLLYQSERAIELWYEDERLVKYRIIGSRKLVGMNPTSFSIEARISKV